MKLSRILSYSILLIFLSIQFSCNGDLFGTSLPAKRPAKIVIEMYDGGGMTPESVNYFISEDSCYVKFFKDQSTNTLRFKLSALQLDSLYAAFYENSFDKITAKEMETHDRGGISITLRFDGKDYNQHDAGSTYINDQWQKNFYAVVTAIIKQANPVVVQNTAPFVVKFDKNILNDSLTFYFQVENFHYNSDSGHKETVRFSLLKGEHTYYATLMSSKKQPSSYQQRIKASAQANLKVWGEADTLFVNLKDSTTIECVQKPR